MTNILYVSHSPADVSGSTLCLLDLVRHLDRTRFTPVLLFSEPGRLNNEFEQLQVPIVYLKLPRYIHNASETLTPIRVRSWISMARSFLVEPPLAQIVRDHHIDIAHINTSAAVSAGITCRRLGIPVVWHVREVIPRGLLGIRRRLLVSTIERCASAIIFISEDEATAFGDTAKGHIIYDPVDLDQFTPNRTDPARVRQELGISPETSVVGFIAAIAHHKGIFELVEAAEEVIRAYHHPVKWLIVGPGRPSLRYPRGVRAGLMNRLGLYVDGLKELQRLLVAKGLEEHFVLTGERTDAPDLIAAMDIVTFPSRLRAIGRPALEAAALAKPIVAASQDRRTRVVKDGETGLLVPPRDPAALGGAILHLLEHPEEARRLGQNGYRYARSTFDSRIHVEQIARVYSLVGGYAR